MEAVEWMEVNAMKKKLCQLNDSFVRAQFDKQFERITNSEKYEDISETASEIQYLIDEFTDLIDVSNYNLKLDSILKSRTYLERIEKIDGLYEFEEKKINEYYISSQGIKQSKMFTDSIMNWWTNEIRTLGKMKTHKDIDKQNMASRLVNNIFYIQIELGDYLYETSQYPLAIKAYNICCFAKPLSKYACYQLARSQALNKNKLATCKTLEKLLELGFKNKKLLESEPAFNLIRESKRYIAILNHLE
jgi:hypothetical protein